MHPDELLPSPFRSPLHRYELMLDVFEGVNRYLGDVANTLQTGRTCSGTPRGWATGLTPPTV